MGPMLNSTFLFVVNILAYFPVYSPFLFRKYVYLLHPQESFKLIWNYIAIFFPLFSFGWESGFSRYLVASCLCSLFVPGLFVMFTICLKRLDPMIQSLPTSSHWQCAPEFLQSLGVPGFVVYFSRDVRVSQSNIYFDKKVGRAVM